MNRGGKHRDPKHRDPENYGSQSYGNKNRLWRWLKQPALHFTLVGGLLYAGVCTWQGDFESTAASLEIAAGQVERLQQELLFELGRPASDDELRAAIDQLIDEEILVRHALALGLDREPTVERRLAQLAEFIEGQNLGSPVEQARELGLQRSDRVVRNILVDRAGRLIRAAVLGREPDEAGLARYLEQNAEEFRGRTRLALMHVELRSGDSSRVERLIQRLRTQDPAATQVAEGSWGDRPSVPSVLPPLSERDLARRFGDSFARQVAEQPQGQWIGPVASRHGWHAVKILERQGGELPTLESVRDRVLARWRHDYAERWLRLRLEQLRQGYRIQVAGAPWAARAQTMATQVGVTEGKLSSEEVS